MNIVAAIKFVSQNYDIILQGTLTIITSVIAILEVINRFIPTKTPDSVITRIGNSLMKAGEFIRKVIDFLKVPNVTKKD